MFKKRYCLLVLLAKSVLITGCSTVKPYQRMYLNDTYMKGAKRTIDKLQENVHTYREGATGGGNGKASGGCGCN